MLNFKKKRKKTKTEKSSPKHLVILMPILTNPLHSNKATVRRMYVCMHAWMYSENCKSQRNGRELFLN